MVDNEVGILQAIQAITNIIVSIRYYKKSWKPDVDMKEFALFHYAESVLQLHSGRSSKYQTAPAGCGRPEREDS